MRAPHPHSAAANPPAASSIIGAIVGRLNDTRSLVCHRQTMAETAVHEARKNPRMARALSADTPLEQVVFWMQDVLEITLLDYVLGQQDRIGNIDYLWRWYWIEDGKLESKKAHGKTVPEDLAAFGPVRLRQSRAARITAAVSRGDVASV